MNDPDEVLNLHAHAQDEAIRRPHLELVRKFTPEHHPEKFAAIRQAYESLKDVSTRLRRRLFDTGEHESIQAIIEELACRSPRRRLSLDALLALTRPS